MIQSEPWPPDLVSLLRDKTAVDLERISSDERDPFRNEEQDCTGDLICGAEATIGPDDLCDQIFHLVFDRDICSHKRRLTASGFDRIDGGIAPRFTPSGDHDLRPGCTGLEGGGSTDTASGSSNEYNSIFRNS